MNGKRLLSWGSYESSVSLAESPIQICEGSPGKSPCRPVTSSHPHWRPSSFEFPSPLLGVQFYGLVCLPESRYGRFISLWTLLGTSIPPAWWEQSNVLHGKRKCLRRLVCALSLKSKGNSEWSMTYRGVSFIQYCD